MTLKFIILFCLSLYVAAHNNDGPCPTAEHWHEFEGRMYCFQTDPTSWSQARRNCEVVGATLVRPDSAAVNDYIRGEIAGSELSYWMDLNDRVTEGEFLYSDGSTPADFSDWEEGEPNNYGKTDHNGVEGEDCAGFVKVFGHKWNDVPCCWAGNKHFGYMGYICQKDI